MHGHTTCTNAKGEAIVSGIKGQLRITKMKIEGTTVENREDGSAVLRLPEGTHPGEGGYVHWEDDVGGSCSALVMPGEEDLRALAAEGQLTADGDFPEPEGDADAARELARQPEDSDADRE